MTIHLVGYKNTVHFPSLSLDSNRCGRIAQIPVSEVLVSEGGDVELESLRQRKEFIFSLIIELLCKKEAANECMVWQKAFAATSPWLLEVVQRKAEESELSAKSSNRKLNYHLE